MKYTIEHDEMRAIRREWINHYLKLIYALKLDVILHEIKAYVRDAERANYGQELKLP